MQRRLRLLQQPMPPLDKGRMKTAPTVPPSRKALIALSKSNSVLLGTLNCRTLMHRCLQGELVLDCIRKGISVLALQEHRIVFPSRGKGDRNHLESFPAGIGWKLILQSATRQTNNAAYGGVGFLVAPGIEIDKTFAPSPRVASIMIAGPNVVPTFLTSFYSDTADKSYETKKATIDVLTPRPPPTHARPRPLEDYHQGRTP